MIKHVLLLAGVTLGVCCCGATLVATPTPSAADPPCCSPGPRVPSVALGALSESGESSQDSRASQPAMPDFQIVAMSKYGFGDTVDMLKGAIEQQNLMVVHVIDAQKMLRMVDVQTKGMQQILFFHPRYMKSILATNPHATIEPPLKIAVMERPDGKVMIRYIKPTYLFGRYDGLDAIGEELEKVMADVVAAATS